MRHKKRKHRLGRTRSERQAMLENMVTSLFSHQRIETTVVKAKEARRLAEKLITLGKNPTLHHRRQAYRLLHDRDLVKVLFDQIAPLFKDRPGGYTRVIRSRSRVGDGAELAILELTEFRPGKIAKTGPRKEQEKGKKKRDRQPSKPEPQPVKEKPPAAEQPPAVEKPKVEKPLPEKPKVEKPPAAEKKPEVPKPEEKKPEEKKGFLKSLRNIFSRKKEQ